MAKTSIEKQEAKLRELNQKIKDEKRKIEQRLGKQIINQAQLDYADLSNEKIKAISKKVADVLNNQQDNKF
ncbi:hypothetical protein [Liquorilactobacillus nagelii]|jgi:molybdopterin converting factor small subunit|uniref:hypothetical protein n=1 Tax=Liquorilactobacillus nagelii TaxID=82688 RepID=UPI001CD00223|nr:hypothetical protein [Liquorilactobacillus nagelii]ULQ49272.1 hypothetical protein J6864_09990 [Liquorilactobacillus nagelii]